MINGARMAFRTVGKTNKKRDVEVGGANNKKTKMTTKWNLINLNLVLLSDKFTAGGGGIVFRIVFNPQPATLPPFYFFSLFYVEKAKGRMHSDNTPAPAE